MKFAAFEAHYRGEKNAGLTVFGILKDSGKKIGNKKIREFLFRIKIPDMLSVMTGGNKDVFVPGIIDLVKVEIDDTLKLTVAEKMERGFLAREVLNDYKRARMQGDREQVENIMWYFRNPSFINDYFRYFGYAFLRVPSDAIPNVSVAFYTFHIMVLLGFLFLLIFVLSLIFIFNGILLKNRWFLWISLIAIPLAYIASESGWVLAEMGRQPWIIQDLMPVSAGVSQISAGSVITTFVLFAALFTALLAAEVSIMVKQIKTGPAHQED